MTITIDTGGVAQQPRIEQYVPDWFRDQCGDAEPGRVAHDYAYHIIGRLTDPNGAKRMETHRKNLIADWGFLKLLAEEHPEVFDEVLTAFAERALG